MLYLIVFGIIGFGVIAYLRHKADREPDESQATISFSTSVEISDEDSGPDNPKYKTWEEAMNRPVLDGSSFWIEYADINGEISERTISPTSIHLQRNQSEVLIKAFCHLRQEERSFRSERILRAKNLKTNRALTDLGMYLRSRH